MKLLELRSLWLRTIFFLTNTIIVHHHLAMNGNSLNRLDLLFFAFLSLHEAVSDFLNRFVRKTTAKNYKMMNRVVQHFWCSFLVVKRMKFK